MPTLTLELTKEERAAHADDDRQDELLMISLVGVEQ